MKVQALVVGAAHMLQLPAPAAMTIILTAVSDRICSLLEDGTATNNEVFLPLLSDH